MDVSDKKPLGSLDRLMVGAGVALLALPVTFLTLLVKPARLAPLLTGADDETEISGKALGPGVFFILSLLTTVFIARLSLGSGGSTKEESLRTETSGLRDASYETGAGLAHLVSGLMERLDAGNLWSAVMMAVPVFLFALALAIVNRALVLGLSPRWKAAHAVGASLYMIGSLLLWTILSVFMIVTISSVTSSMLAPLVGFLFMVTGLSLTGVQAYAFWEAFEVPAGARLGLASPAIPVAIVAMTVSLIIILTG